MTKLKYETENNMREKINTEIRKLKTWCQSEFKSTRELFHVPGVIALESESNIFDVQLPRNPLYRDFKEFTIA